MARERGRSALRSSHSLPQLDGALRHPAPMCARVQPNSADEARVAGTPRRLHNSTVLAWLR